MTIAPARNGATPPEIVSFADILGEHAVLADLRVTSKKHLCQEIARAAAELTGAAQRDIFESILERERLGSTGMGYGVAIPHASVEGLDRVRGVFARLDQPIEFDSIDERPVDLVFLLLAPAEPNADRLKVLARVSRALRRQDYREKLRAAPSPDALRALLFGESAEDDAAAS